MPLADVIARTAARKAAGADQTYPEHANGERRQSDRTTPPAPPACALIGRELTGDERQELNLDHRRVWRLCLHDDKPLGEAVCNCGGCGPKCPGYAT